MGKRLDTDGFISKARLKHGDRYDYSKTIYTNQTTPVIIICREHGEFQQRPNNHYMGAGCPVCSGNKKHTVESFIVKAREIHGDKYDYSKVEYEGNKSKVIIMCPEHGEFEQTPDKHMRGEGCPDCSQAKLEETNMQKYGNARPLQNESIRNKYQQTCLEKYGADNPSRNEDVKQKRIDTCIAKYDVPYSVQASHIRDKKEETCRLKYGGNSPFCSEEIRKRASDTIFKKYGVRNTMHLADNVYKVAKTKAVNHTFHTSKPEEALYEMLCEHFGSEDIVRQYLSDEYSYACDFYIKSRDLYIELNASWTHGNHWFGTGTTDNDVKTEWLSKKTEYYNNAVEVWSDKDLKKRESALLNKLNYVVFWDNKLRDAIVWFALNCPDGQDYIEEYSWLPKRSIEIPDKNIALTGTHTNINSIAKNYQFGVFYEKEIQMWNGNEYYQGIPLQIWIYHNRYKYLNKVPCELSDAEILRAFTIAGIYKGYTVFDSSLMQQVIDMYDIKSVYDPCAGWGERMLCCYHNNVSYTGVDINQKLEAGYTAMIDNYSMDKQNIVYADSTEYSPDKTYDAVITCPPYYDTEIYTDIGSENYSYADFLQWWKNIVMQCFGVRYFCFQINNKYRHDMLDIVENCGFILIQELTFDNNKSSHFTRRKGVNLKKECETMLVFERKDAIIKNKLDSIKTVKELREHVDMSQSEFADYFGVSLRCLRSWEQEQRNIPEYVFNAFKKIVMYEEMLNR